MTVTKENTYNPEGMLGSYLYESFQLIEQMEEIALSEDDAGFFDRDSISEIFRIVHTIKGSSGIMLYDNIAKAAHRLEDIFYYLREASAEDIPKKELSKYIIQVSDFISGELYKINKGQNPDGDPQEVFDSIEIYLEALKAEIRESGMELPPENIYEESGQYYIAPISDEERPLKIDLGEEPEPGDYVVKNNKDRKENIVGISIENLEKLFLSVEKLEYLENNNKCSKLHKAIEELKVTVNNIMQAPVGGVFRKMNRVVFDVSNKLDKDIELKLQGEGIMVDRMLLEQITGSLMHLVRNAADHGIESSGERLDVGKTAKGTIELKAFKEDDKLYILVEDDGRGLDKDRIFEKAKQIKLVDGSISMGEYSDEQIYEFITCAGFTTKDRATEISGRGVGMDVVANTLKDIGGSLRIDSTPGEGTEMIMEIPLH